MLREGRFGLHGRVCDLLYTKMGYCGGRVLPYIPPRLDGPWWSIRREREWQGFEAEHRTCTCNISAELNFILNVTCNAFLVLLFLMLTPFPDLR